MSGADVQQLQDYLVSQGLMSQADLTGGYGTYGPKTEQAVANLQTQLGVDTSDGGIGRFGPRTLQAVNTQLSGQTPQGGANIANGGGLGGAVDTTVGGATPGQPQQPPTETTGNAQLDELYNTLKEYVKGLTVNPNIELTPADLQRFYDQASAEINPYYSSQLKGISDDLSKNIGFLQKQYETEKQQVGEQFRSTLGQNRETAAASGTAFSGGRARQERDLASLYGQELESKALGLEQKIGGALREAESQIGSQNVQGILGGAPSFASAGVSLEGRGGLTSGRQLSFAPTGGLTGSLEYQQRGDVRSLQDLLSSEEIKKRSRTGIASLYS